MINAGSCSLIIRADKLNIEEIEQNLQLKHSRFVRKGEVISKTFGEFLLDTWIFEQKNFMNEASVDPLKSMLDSLGASKKYVGILTNYADVTIKLYIQSEYAQINF